MATYTLAPVPGQIFLDNVGNIMPGGHLWTYAAGLSTASPTYTTQDGSVQNTNPIVLDGFGRPPQDIFLPPGITQTWVLTDATGVTIRTYPAVAAVPLSAANQDVVGTAGEVLTAGQTVYLSDGSGGKVAGQWYLADADFNYASTLPEIGIVPSTIAMGAQGTIRLGGQITGLSGLTIGASYYISATAGGLTTVNTGRFVGQADSTSSLVLGKDPVAFVPATCNGRLTLTTGTPVPSADVSAATAAFFTPYLGNQIALYNGGSWVLRSFAEITISLVGLTASKPYDIFAFDNAGVVTIETLVWTSATARATALTRQDGVYVKTGALTRRYLGTIYVNASGGQTDDTFAKRYVWNYYNRVRRGMRVNESTASWTYTTAAFRQANGATTNQLDMMIGLDEVLLEVNLAAMSTNGTASVFRTVAIGEDSTTTPLANQQHNSVNTIASSEEYLHVASIQHAPAVGRHFYAWLETSTASGTTTWYGTTAAGAVNDQQGLNGSIEG